MFAPRRDITARIAEASPNDSSAFQTAMTRGETLWVVAAGNNGMNIGADARDADLPGIFQSPADLLAEMADDSVVVVGATGPTSELTPRVSNFSNYGDGDQVELWAPGRLHVLRPGPDAATTLEPVQGTSFSSPVVAGIAALALSVHPDAVPGVGTRLRDRLLGATYGFDYAQSCDPFPRPPLDSTPLRHIDAQRAVQ